MHFYAPEMLCVLTKLLIDAASQL